MSGGTQRRKAPARPSLGALAPAAACSWAAALCAEALSWQAYLDESSLLQELQMAANHVAEGLGTFSIASLAAVAVAAALLAACLCRPKAALRLLRLLGRQARFWAVPALAFACVFTCSAIWWQSWADDVESVSGQLAQGGSCQVELTGDPAERDYGTVSEGRLICEGHHSVALRILWPSGAQPCTAGHLLQVSGTLSAPRDNEGGRWNHQQGFVGMLSAKSVQDAGAASGLRGLLAPVRDAALSRIAQLGGDAAGLLGGILLGNRQLYAGTELEQDFRTTGLAHLMAVSGTHLAVVAMLAGWVLGALRLKRLLRNVALAALMASYVALTCFAPSAMRAACMCLAALAAGHTGRRRHILTALSACVLLFLASSPMLAFSVGYQLSVLCMVGLLTLAPLLGAWLAWLVPVRLEEAAQGVGATVAANMATLPVTVPLFYQLPLISPLSTLLASPLVTLALGLGLPALLVGQVFPGLGDALLHVAGAVAQLCATLVHGLADLPGACVPLQGQAGWMGVLCALAAILLWVVWPLPPGMRTSSQGSEGKAVPAWNPHSRGTSSPHLPAALRGAAGRVGVLAVFALPAVLLLVVEMGGFSGCANVYSTVVKSDAQVVMIDVGQGDSMLVRDGDAAMLIDTGEEDDLLLQGLARHGVTHLNAVVLTHKDADHTGSLSALAGVVRIDHVYIHKDLLSSEDEETVLKAASWVTEGGAEGIGVGTTLRIGRFTWRMLSPVQGGESENDDSLVGLLAFDADGDGTPEARGLTTGDAESQALEGVVGEVGQVDWVKVPHHGSADALSVQELEQLKPRIALIGVGANNEYGHPTQQTLSRLQGSGAKVYRTDTQGDILLAFDAERIGVSTQR